MWLGYNEKDGTLGTPGYLEFCVFRSCKNLSNKPATMS